MIDSVKVISHYREKDLLEPLTLAAIEAATSEAM